jgi:molybdopterin-containing oxidoreductase family iron-sulfur binding subunit
MKNGMNRRDFLALMGAGTAAASVGCQQSKFTETWKPWVEPVAGMMPHRPWHYATTSLEHLGVGLHIKTVGGRAIKADGNPRHEMSQGALDARTQSLVQGLYADNRVTTPLLNGEAIGWDQALDLLNQHLAPAEQGKGLYALTSRLYGQRLSRWEQLVAKGKKGRLIQFDAFNDGALREASQHLFGTTAAPLTDLRGVGTIVCFGAPFLESWGPYLANQKHYADFKSRIKDRGLHIQVESRRSLTGANADRWIGVKPGAEVALALALLVTLAKDKANESATHAAIASWVAGINAADLLAQSGVSEDSFQFLLDQLRKASHVVVIPADEVTNGRDAVAHQMTVLLLNVLLGGLGTHVRFDRGALPETRLTHQSLLDLKQALEQGAVDVLLVHGANPVYSLPQESWSSLLKKAPFVIAFADTMDETVACANLVIPSVHELEAWGEVTHFAGDHLLQQPVMEPRWKVVQPEDAIRPFISPDLPLLRDSIKASFIEKYLQKALDPEQAWRDALRQGGSFAESSENQGPALRSDANVGVLSSYRPAVFSGDTLIFQRSARFFDGRSANRGWLQELPEAMTGITWDSWLEMHRETAESRGLRLGDHVELKAGDTTVSLPVVPVETIVPGVFCLETGQGHTHYGEVFNRGVNAFSFIAKTPQPHGDFSLTPLAASITPLGKRERLALNHLLGKGDRLTQPLSKTNDDPTPDFNGQDYDRDIFQFVDKTALDEHHHDDHHGHGGGDPNSTFPLHVRNDFYPDRREDPVIAGRDETFYQFYKWEMNIDLNRCNGCGACTVACNAENNIPVMGKDQVAKGRVMSWIRINKYLTFHASEQGEETQVHFMPMLCQQCGSAPCETVCPSLATYHNKEGLNAMIYNRCVGTRYCANNCTYKTRRFNWFDAEFSDHLRWQLNPEVTVRSRGIMEKCTFCIQRINEVRDDAKNQGRLILDGEVKTACQQACPAHAIHFGNVNDEGSQLVQERKVPLNKARAYKSLDHHIHTRPAITYFKKVTVSSGLGSEQSSHDHGAEPVDPGHHG